MGRRWWEREAALLGAFLAAFAIATGIGISINNAFGYDESVYASLTRLWIEGTPAPGWGLHRPPMLSVLGILPQLAGAAEWSFRAEGLLFGLTTVVACWWFGRVVAGPVGGAVSGLIVATAAPLQVEAGTFLTDVPSASMVVCLAALLWRQVGGPRPIGRAFVILAPIAALAFYTRYGSMVAIGSLALAAMAVAGPRLWRARRIVLAAMALFFLLLAPHAVVAVQHVGVPWGILQLAEGAAASRDASWPLLQYLGWFPFQLLGPAGAAVALVGVGTILTTLLGAAIQRRVPDPFVAYMGIAVAAQLAVLALQIHAEPRYLFVPMLLLVITGARRIAVVVRPWASRRIGLAAAAAAATMLVLVALVSTSAEVQRRGQSYDWTRDVGLFIGQHARGPCSVLTADVPIISWYSRCAAINFAVASGSNQLTVLRGDRFVVLRADGLHQPSASVLASVYLPRLRLMRTFRDGLGRPSATVYAVRATTGQ
jgi:small basic protein